MPSPRTMGIGLTLACADQEKIVWRFVSATISSAVILPIVSVVVIWYSSRLPGGELRRAYCRAGTSARAILCKSRESRRAKDAIASWRVVFEVGAAGCRPASRLEG